MSETQTQNEAQEALSGPSGPSVGESALRDALGDLECVDAKLRKIHTTLIEAPREGTLTSAVDLALATLTQDVAASILKVGTAILDGRYSIRCCELERERVTKRGI